MASARRIATAISARTGSSLADDLLEPAALEADDRWPCDDGIATLPEMSAAGGADGTSGSGGASPSGGISGAGG